MYVCVHIYIYARTYVCIFIYMHVRMCTYLHKPVHVSRNEVYVRLCLVTFITHTNKFLVFVNIDVGYSRLCLHS